MANPILSVKKVIPGLEEGSAFQMGIQRIISVPIGPPLLVNAATYKQALFVAPCAGCKILEGWLSCAVAIASGTNTLAIDNYDVSAAAARNVLSTTNIDPDAATAPVIVAKTGSKLTLSTTVANLDMDEGDVLNCTLVCGTQGTAGEGYQLTFIILIPELA